MIFHVKDPLIQESLSVVELERGQSWKTTALVVSVNM